jgi:transcriptional accessory protein Tex/SPT6
MKMMDKNTETALVFAATIIMEQVCDNPKFSEKQRDKMRKWARLLIDLADEKEAD